MNAIFSKRAAKILERLDSSTRDRIIAGIRKIPQGDVKRLVGCSDAQLRLRIGKYRILFDYTAENNEQIAYIDDIGSRGNIYK